MTGVLVRGLRSRTLFVADGRGDGPVYDQREWTLDLPAAYYLRGGELFLELPKHLPCRVAILSVEYVAVPAWARGGAEEPAAPEVPAVVSPKGNVVAPDEDATAVDESEEERYEREANALVEEEVAVESAAGKEATPAV